MSDEFRMLVVWEISDDRASIFGRGELLMRDWPRLYQDRDDAEAWMQSHVEAHHKRYVEERADYAGTEDGREEFQDDEILWWQSSPPITVERTDKQTWWGVGDDQWSDRDRRGASYAWLNRRKVKGKSCGTATGDGS